MVIYRDISSRIELIEKFNHPINNFEDYMADLKTQSAIERQLGIIGKAVIKYNNMLPENSLQHAEKLLDSETG